MHANDVYVLCGNRSPEMATSFLDAFLPSRLPAADEYPFPQFADAPTDTLSNPEEIILKLAHLENERYGLHWHNTRREEPLGASLFYTADGGLVAGLFLYEDNVLEWLAKMARVVGGRFGYMTLEAPPPETQTAFVELCRASQFPRLFDGRCIAATFEGRE